MSHCHWSVSGETAQQLGRFEPVELALFVHPPRRTGTHRQRAFGRGGGAQPKPGPAQDHGSRPLIDVYQGLGVVTHPMTNDPPRHGLRWSTMSLVPGPLDSPHPSVEARVEFGAQSRQGRRRSTNRDHYLIVRLDRGQETLLTSLPDADAPERFAEHGYGMVLADGAGGDGEAASRLAVTTLSHLVVTFGRWNLRISEEIADEVVDRAERFYRSIDLTLSRTGRQNPLGLRTTLTAVYTTGSELFFAHVGDSRAYLFRDGQLMQLTHDHPVAGGSLGGKVSDDPQEIDLPLSDTIGRPARAARESTSSALVSWTATSSSCARTG